MKMTPRSSARHDISLYLSQLRIFPAVTLPRTTR